MANTNSACTSPPTSTRCRTKPSAVRRLALVLVLACCSDKKSRTTDTHSTSLATAKERVAFLCSYTLCPSPVRDAAFHVVYQDNSGGLVSGADDAVIHAVAAISKADVDKWSRGCIETPVPARPDWLDAMIDGTTFSPTTAPHGLRCGDELRGVHVKDGLVVRSIETR